MGPINKIYPFLPGSRLRGFIAIQVQHSYTSSTNGWTFRTRVLTLSCWDSNSQIPT